MPMPRAQKAALAAVVVLAAFLRSSGMSHDLHEGWIYNPDTPKQIHAIQRFYENEYYWHIGNKDYDGYPLFHAHLIEYFLRAAEPARQGVAFLLGIPTKPNALLDEVTLIWILLAMNVVLSTATVPLVFSIGRESFGLTAAWIAAGLLALSPVDVTAAHMATGDATTAFFAALSLLFSLRVYRCGRCRDYVFAAATAAFAFAAKYFAATAFFTLAAAHLFRAGSLRPAAWLSPPMLRRIGAAAAAAIVALFLAVPSLFTHLVPQLADIWNAMRVSTERFPATLSGAGAWDRFLFSMHVNLPDLLRAISPMAAAAVLLAVGTRMRRDPRVWILLVGPVLYIVLAVGSRGLVNPVYHTVVTPPLFLLTAFCCMRTWEFPEPWRYAARTATRAALLSAGWLLSLDTSNEIYFSRHMDTRRMAESWVAENVPRSFPATVSRYTFQRSWDDRPGIQPPGSLFVSSALAPIQISPAALQLKRFRLEDAPLTQFRNIGEDVYLMSTSMVRTGCSLPTGQRWPSSDGNEFIFDNGVDLLRSEKVFIATPGQTLARIVVTDRPLPEAWIVVRAAAPPAAVRVSFGGRTKLLRVTTPTCALLHVPAPAPAFPSRDGRYFYRYDIESPTAQVRVELATRSLDAGWMLSNGGRDAEAAPLLARGALATRDPAAAAQAIVCAQATGRTLAGMDTTRLIALARRATCVVDDASLFAASGIHPAYIDDLPFLEIGADELSSNGFRPTPPSFAPDSQKGFSELIVSGNRHARPEGGIFQVETGPLMLDPGFYRSDLLVRSATGGHHSQPMALIVSDAQGTPLVESTLNLPPLDARPYTDVPFEFDVPPGTTACTIRLQSMQPPDLAIGGLKIRPDLLANAIQLGAEVKAILDAAGIEDLWRRAIGSREKNAVSRPPSKDRS